MRNTKFNAWWRQVNKALEDEGRSVVLLRQAAAWWAEGLTPAQAALRFVENVESSLEERSHYDV